MVLIIRFARTSFFRLSYFIIKQRAGTKTIILHCFVVFVLRCWSPAAKLRHGIRFFSHFLK